LLKAPYGTPSSKWSTASPEPSAPLLQARTPGGLGENEQVQFSTNKHESSYPFLMKDKLRDFIFNELVFVSDPDRFGDDEDLLDAGLDSMGIMRLTMFIESRFQVTLPDEEIEPENLRSLNALEQWVLRHQS